ncbi:DUF3492 domain-containing protein [Actinoplanes sp. TFC3]|uniref:DUF3492 domain-containing protein n=1 Tax=Actinoplanes sp. TFC3 TaxID=1710355 RepID=UPI000829F09B|nr:DUF3492 domain-containing protein [Actinoplanes sp. TFC3]
MRICLLTGGGYPFRRDALGGWCRSLVDGLAGRGVRFHLVSVGDRETLGGPAYRLPEHVESARTVVLPRDNAGSKKQATLLCEGLAEQNDEKFAAGLKALTRESLEAEALSDAWRAAREAGRAERLPRLSRRDARTAVTLLRHAARALAVPLPESDLVHCVGGTTPLLTALAGHWVSGSPILLTEARAPVARLRASEERLSSAVRTVLRRFRRAVARTGYAEAGLIAPLSEYHHAWALRHGAEPSRLIPVPAGVDPLDFPVAPEPRQPLAIVWAGNGGPQSGLIVLLNAFAQITRAVPGTVLHLVGVAPVHEEHAAALIERSGLGRAVRLHPLPADPRHRYAPGHLVVHLPGPSDPPYRLIEAMMSGRAVVGADAGPVAETLADTGVVVPPNDPATLADACISLLIAPARRRALGEAARRRALAYFTTDRVVNAYGALYTDLAGPPPAPAYELTLAVPAPRTPRPATLRWLAAAQDDT